MILYENGDPVTTSDGRGPGYRGCLNDFDRAMIDMIRDVRAVHVLTVEDV
jgi:hypothetical protein